MSLVTPNNLPSSFRFAFRGVRQVYQQERNFRIHTVLGGCALILAVLLEASATQWLFIITAIASVLILEVVNTTFEHLLDMIHPRVHEYAAAIKDLMAAAVLLASISAVVVGVIIFIPLILTRIA